MAMYDDLAQDYMGARDTEVSPVAMRRYDVPLTVMSKVEMESVIAQEYGDQNGISTSSQLDLTVVQDRTLNDVGVSVMVDEPWYESSPPTDDLQPRSLLVEWNGEEVSDWTNSPDTRYNTISMSRCSFHQIIRSDIGECPRYNT